MIVDDHPIMRRGLRDTLAAETGLEICAEAADVGDALEQMRAVRPDLVIIDISLPSGSGLELAKQMLALNDKLRILFVSIHDDAIFAERVLRAGALGYINKSRPGDELIEAVRKVARGEIALSPSVADRLVRRGASATQGAGIGQESLSDRELEVFELIGRGLSTREIAERLCLSVKTIETHREHIKAKLRLESGAELTRRAILAASART